MPDADISVMHYSSHPLLGEIFNLQLTTNITWVAYFSIKPNFGIGSTTSSAFAFTVSKAYKNNYSLSPILMKKLSSLSYGDKR